MPKILIADDSAFMRRILIGILNKIGYTDIIEAEDGEQTVELYKKENPDLVLLDIIMRKKYGTEALKEIMEHNKDAKVIMVSAVGQEKVIQEALGLGAKGFVVKPFTEEELKSEIRKVLG